MEEYTPRKEKVLDELQSKNIEYARYIFACIVWQPFEEMIGDGIYLNNLFKCGVDGYEENIRRVLRFLYQYVRQNRDLLNAEVAKRVNKRMGKITALLPDSAPRYRERKFDIAFILDLDANMLETV